MKNLLEVKLKITMMMAVVGCGLIIAGIWIPPSGEIHNSVLIAFGEILTFVGMVFGMKYDYQKTLIKHEKIFRWAMKKGVDITDKSDDLDDLDSLDKKDPSPVDEEGAKGL